MQFNTGDLVKLKASKDFPDCQGSLTAVKFYKLLIDECGDKFMLIIKQFSSDADTNIVLVNGYKKPISSKFLVKIEEDSEDINEFKKV